MLGGHVADRGIPAKASGRMHQSMAVETLIVMPCTMDIVSSGHGYRRLRELDKPYCFARPQVMSPWLSSSPPCRRCASEAYSLRRF